jgi:AcrR family transcriptional regulator
MPRSGEDARRRLQEAAYELIRERGYDAVTTAEIAARAGVTERTFFRHFPDKREVLFAGEEAFHDALTDAVMAAPEGSNPMGVLLWVFRSVAPMFEANRPLTEPMQAVIARSPALQERVLTKTAGSIEALAAALGRRGVEAGLATLTAQVGMSTFRHAVSAWFDDPALGLDAWVTRAFDQLRALSSTLDGADPMAR